MGEQSSSKEEQIRLYDEDIREPLFDYLEERFGKIRIFEEKRIGRSRADSIMLTEESIVGIEIKSDVDTYERLKKQVRNYNRFADFNYVVIGKRHAKHIEEHVPEQWGILLAKEEKGTVHITEVRGALENPKRKKEIQITMLWRPELQRILAMNHLPVYKQKSKAFVQQKLLDKVDWVLLKSQMCEEMFERDYTLWDEELEQWKSQEYAPTHGKSEALM